MKLALLFVVACTVGYSAARSVLTAPSCGPEDVGKKYPHGQNPQRYFECTSSGLELKRCPPGDWFSDKCQDCVKAGNNRPDTCPGDSSEEDSDSNSDSDSSEDPQPEPEEPTPAPEEPVPEPTEPAPEPEHPESSESNEDPEPEPEEPESSESNEDPEPEPEEPTPAPEEPTPAPEEPTPAPEEPTPAPEEPTPAPEEPTPAPEEPTPAPEEPTPAPEEPTPEPRPCTVECTQPWDVPEYHPNPYSCHSFYQCANGVPVLHDCPAGLVYDPNVRPGPTCVWPRDYHCTPSCHAFKF